MTHEEIAETLYDELQHNKILNYEEYSERLYGLIDLAHPNEEKVGGYVSEVETILHNRWSFGFCDMCGEYINYDDDVWYDLGFAEPDEQDILEETLPIFQKEAGQQIQDVCSNCWHKLLKKGGKYIEKHNSLNQSNRECYNSGWQDGFADALDMVLEAINNNYNEADREGDDEYINERIVGWNNIENIIKEIKESHLGNKEENEK